MHPDLYIHREKYTVRSYDADQSGLLTFESLARFLQESAYHHAEALGVGYNRLKANGLGWVLSRLHIRMADPPMWGDHVIVETWPKQKDRIFYIRDFRLLNEKDEHLASVTSSWLVIDMNKRRPSSFKPLDAMLGDLPDRHAIRTAAEKLPALQEPWNIYEHKVFPSDIDVNGHVNNTRYIRWACDHLGSPERKKVQVKEVTLNFLSELHLNDSIEIHRKAFPEGDSYLFSIVNQDLNTESARIQVSWQ